METGHYIATGEEGMAMPARRLTPAATAYVWAVVLVGLGVFNHLVASGDPSAWDWRPILMFGSLGVLATAVSFSYQGYLPSVVVHQIGTSFAYALCFIVDPGAVCFVLLVMAAADWGLNRRRPITAVFNMGQLMLALGAAVAVRSWIRPGFTNLDGVDPRTTLAALASLLAFFLVNHALTHLVISLASRRPLVRVDAGTRSGLLNEVFCIVSGLSMAILWWVAPWLSLLGVIPIWVLILLMVQLSKREQELEARQVELKSLQGLGLEIGAELDAERLRRAVVRIATDALQASGALLAVVDPTREHLTVQAHHGIRPEPPAKLPLSRLDDKFFESGQIRLIRDFYGERALYPELAFLAANGVLCAPLQILGKRLGLLILVHGERRRPFDEHDVRRLETLVRFVDVALSNSQLVTDLKQMQAQLIQTEKMSALGMLVSGVAHELNNPLTSVMGYTQLLLGRESEPERARMLEKVFAEAERAGRIVQNLLTFSRKHKSEKVLTDVNATVERVLDLRDYEFRVNNLEVVRRLAPGLVPVLADGHQLQQVFLNLITNAEQAINETGRPGRIEVETRNFGDWIRVTVSDNGPGIQPENLKRVFLPFFTTKDVGRGTGLGLSICYGIIQDHGGRIEVESRPEEGATFVVDVPIARLSTEIDVHPVSPPAERRDELSATSGRLLVVDDEESIIDLVRDVLEPRGWQVSAARDGAEALEIVRRSPFDVLLVDMRMPGMDGKAFYEALHESRPELARRVVFATGDSGSDVTSRFLEDTGSPVLGKPYDLGSLVDAVSRVVADASQLR